MSQYLLSFARDNLIGKSDAYVALLLSMSKVTEAKGRFSDLIKSHLPTDTKELLDTDYQRIARRFKRVLDGKSELDWVAPSGLSPLAQLQVKNFRGFGEFGPEDRGTLLRFGKIKNIFYAPNGGGKSSLCEALEFATTGHIKEANRRKTRVRQYIARGSAKPTISLVDVAKQPVTPSLTWSSCFIDRNRLQEFSLLGSKDTGSDEADVIATLFGLEEFQSVLSRFVRPESFNLKNILRPDSAELLAHLEKEMQGLRLQRETYSARINVLNEEVCKHLGLRVEQQDAVRLRHNRPMKLAELKIRAAERRRFSKLPSVFSTKTVRRFISIAERLIARKTKIEAALVQNAAAINYRALYEAVHAVEDTHADERCPACSTPFKDLTENPFDKARSELSKFGALERLQVSYDKTMRRLALAATTISETKRKVESNELLGLTPSLPIKAIQAAVSKFELASDGAALPEEVVNEVLTAVKGNLAAVDTYIQECATKHMHLSQSDDQIKLLNQQALELKSTDEAVRALFTEKKSTQFSLKKAGERIASLIQQREKIAGRDAANKEFNKFVLELEKEYGNLHRDLFDFKLSLEQSRIAGIESKAAQYYKAINLHDDEHEQIDSLSFEKAGDAYRIKVFGPTGASLDAFSELSEGHLRALGLSLLLAMAEKNKFPLIVFDDVVNAIDSEHRSNIIDLFFSDEYLRSTQMVITTHDRLFWERFCIIAERHRQAESHISSVLSYTNKGIVVIDHAGGFQEKVHRALGVYDIRQALVYCRIWFESMVLEFCLEQNVSVTAKFRRSQLKQGNFLQMSLEKTFAEVEPLFAYDMSNFALIKKDLVNWGGQNQEHHAFDEANFNFVHSKTSSEVSRIYDAIRLLECQLFPDKKKISCTNFLADLTQRIERCETKIAQLVKAPVAVQEEHKQILHKLQKRRDEVSQESAYIDACLAGAQR